MFSTAHARSVARKLTPCAVPGCTKTVHALSSYCARHANNNLRHGSPTQAALYLYQLKPYATRVSQFMKDNADHPALNLAYSEIDGWLTEGARQGEQYLAVRTATRMPTWQHRLAAECWRLKQNGVTGKMVFETVVATYLLANADPGRLEPFSKAHRYQTSRLVFNLAPRKGRRKMNAQGRIMKYPTRLGAELLNNFGNQILLYLLPLLDKITKAFNEADHRDEKRRDALLTAMRAHSFNITEAVA